MSDPHWLAQSHGPAQPRDRDIGASLSRVWGTRKPPTPSLLSGSSGQHGITADGPASRTDPTTLRHRIGAAVSDEYHGAPVRTPHVAPDPALAHYASPVLSTSPGAVENHARSLSRLVTEREAASGLGLTRQRSQHHRTTSIVHGRQHSRTDSAATASSGSRSPQIFFATSVRDPPQAEIMADSMASSTSSLTASRSGASMDSAGSSRKMERMHSSSGSRGRNKEHGRQHSNPKSKGEKTVSEYALHVLFTSFIAQAEEKIAFCNAAMETEPDIEHICGRGVDPVFDQLISALSHIASSKPKPLIDSMMLWRKNKSDHANEAKKVLDSMPSTMHTSSNPRKPNDTAHTSPDPGDTTGQPSYAARQEFFLEAERASTASIYILCRVLMDVIGQSTLSRITFEMEDKLEAIVFGQLKVNDIESLCRSPLRMANWALFGRLLGVMASINFESVTNRFTADLEICQNELATAQKPVLHKEVEGRVELVLGGLKYIHLQLSTAEAWEMSCNLMIALGHFFTRSHGQRQKYAYCQAIDILLLRVAGQAILELNTPKWNTVLANIAPRLTTMSNKPRHWPVALPLTATILCVSPPEAFSTQWSQLVLSLQPKLKDRYTRPICLQVVSRLLWTYLYRCPDKDMLSIKKVEDVIKVIMPAIKKTYNTTDPAIAEPLIQIIRIIGFRHPDFCFRSIIFPLVNADLILNMREMKVDQLEPEKIVVGIRVFLAIMSDLERGQDGRPPFPQQYAALANLDKSHTAKIMAPPRASGDALEAADLVPDKQTSPFKVGVLSEVAKDYYAKFCELLGRITIICDNTFGGQAVLDEKFSSPVPKTPMSETFNFTWRDDQGPSEQKQGFYELLQVAVQALPRCLSPGIPFNPLINLLCTGTAHVQLNIADTSAQSLKAIAKQGHAQQVTIGFARFIFNFDDRYSTMSDGGLLGPGHIENTLKLYVELLQVWIEEIKQKSKDAAGDSTTDNASEKRGLQLDLSGLLAHVDEAESHGLFFLCSQARRVRAIAITVLRLITEFDTALGKSNIRLIHILEGNSTEVMDPSDESLSVAERSRLQRGLHKKDALLDLCHSEVTYDTTLWFKLFPNLVRLSQQKCPSVIILGRELICNRILQMYKNILVLSETTRGPQQSSYDRVDLGSGRYMRTSSTPPEVLVEQWKIYLIVACTTLSDQGSQQQLPSVPIQHYRKGSKPNSGLEKITSARTLYKYLIPLLSVGPASIRDSVVTALGSINLYIYKALLEELQGAVKSCGDEGRARMHQRNGSGPRRNRRTDILRTEITSVYRSTSHFLKEGIIYNDDWILDNIVSFTKDLKIFLMDSEVQMDWEFQKLRRHYCGLMQELFEGINRTGDPARWMTFEARKSSFALMEDWCGYSPNQNQIKQREESMRQSVIDQQTLGERGTVTAAMEIEKRNLRTAALSAMAALCGGPVSVTTESKANLQFDIRRMLSWIETIFSTGSDRMHVIGRRALKNLIVHNKEFTYLLEHSIMKCYVADVPKVLDSYFVVVTEVLLENPDYALPSWKLLGIGLFTLGSESSSIRSKSAHVLRAVEERQQRSSKIQDFDISISDKTRAVYKLAQFEISKRLSLRHSELAFMIFSEFTAYFKDLQPTAQRNMVAAVLPWIQIVELKVDPNGGPSAQSYVLLANLLEITIRSSSTLHNEVQALWQALATGPHGGNVQLVLDFIMSLCLDKREQNFVGYAKQVVVFLSSTPAGIKVVEFLLMQINPKAMIPNEKREPLAPPPDVARYPYVAELSEALPIGTKQSGFSLGQLSLILLVDLMVSPLQLALDAVPLLLQAIVVLWDHYIPLVQEQAREMLIHLIHELVISRMDDAEHVTSKKDVDDFIELIRKNEATIVWQYEDNNGKSSQDNKVPDGMELLSSKIIKTFTITYPGIQEHWAKLSLTWATCCPVRHLACRSFQIFRCILTSLDQQMLADMLVRLSNTIADDDPDVQTFSMEILTTLKTLICKLAPKDLMTFPQLFWTTCACLDTINEREFLEALGMLEELLSKLDLDDSSTRMLLVDGRPSRWEGVFDGLQSLVYKGLRSSACLDVTLTTLDKLVKLPNDDLVGDETRLLFAILAHFPRFLHAMDQGITEMGYTQSATILADLAAVQGHPHISRSLRSYAAGRQRSSQEFLHQLVAAIKETFLPLWDFASLTFLMGFLTNDIAWYKLNAMRILVVLIPDIDMRKPEIAGHGPDLISPLLRLLQTEYCMQALEVLDQIMTMSGTSMDKQHLRMSMTKPSSKAIRKEYERTQSLFGIPEDSGWSIPMPAKHAETTRLNVHAAFYMCQSEDNTDTEPIPTPDVEFHDDEFHYGYFPPPERTDTMLSEEGRGDANINDLVMKLDSLDDFFEDSLASPTSDDRSSRTITELGFSSDASTRNSGAQLYDEQTLPILQHSLSHHSSEGGFPNGFADARSGGHTPNIMNPVAFSSGDSTLHDRPSLHSRSITSPSAPASYQASSVLSAYMSDNDSVDEVFSDGDDERTTAAATPTGESGSILGKFARTRAGMRRFTGGRKTDRDRFRDGSSQSVSSAASAGSGVGGSASLAGLGSGSGSGGLGMSTKRAGNAALASPEVPKVPHGFMASMPGSVEGR